VTPAHAPTSARRWWILATLSVILLMVALDTTVINVALPRAQVELHFSLANRQWPITAYVLAFGTLLLVAGRLSDLWGRRTTLLLGLVGFAAASAAGGAASSFSTLVTARAVQGAFGAVLAPAALAALTTTFAVPRERSRAFSIYGAIGGSGLVLGLLLGGALTQWASWRWCLYVNLFFAVIALAGVVLFVAPARGSRPAHFDAAGTVLASGGIFLVVFGFSNAVTSGWDSTATWASLAAGVVLAVSFVFWQGHASHPLLPLRVVGQRTRAGSLLALFLASVGVFGTSLFLAYYLQGTYGYSPVRTGVAFLPLAISIGVSVSVGSARLLDRVGPRPLVPVGMILAMLGMILFTRLTVSADYLGHVLPGLVVLGLGLGLIIPAATASATAAVDAGDAGAASAMVNTSQQVGASVGTALLNTIAVSVTSRVISHATSGGAPITLLHAEHATLHGYAVAFWWAAGFFGVGALASAVLLESGPVGDGWPAQISGQG
jgi:EmrB/QacA subfamily drug resistance transporter